MNEQTVTPQEYFKGFPEAPTSDTIKWTDKHGIEHMTTIRAWSPEGLIQAVDRFISARFESGEAKEPAKPAVTPAPAAPATQKAATTDTGVNTMAIKKMTVAPQADGKVKIGLYADGHKFPDLYMSLGLDATLKTLAGTGLEWTAEHLSAVAEFNVDFLADWRNSDKLNTKGNPYKNVVALRSTEAGLPF
jgi:hypothetical protein